MSRGLGDVYKRQVYRGRGIGRKIVRQLLERLTKDGVNWVGLIAERGSHPFYERLGFGIMQDATPMVRIQS